MNMDTERAIRKGSYSQLSILSGLNNYRENVGVSFLRGKANYP